MRVVVSLFHFVPALIIGMVNAVATLYIDLKKMKLRRTEENEEKVFFSPLRRRASQRQRRGKKKKWGSSLLLSLRFLCVLCASAVN